MFTGHSRLTKFELCSHPRVFSMNIIIHSVMYVCDIGNLVNVFIGHPTITHDMCTQEGVSLSRRHQYSSCAVRNLNEKGFIGAVFNAAKHPVAISPLTSVMFTITHPFQALLVIHYCPMFVPPILFELFSNHICIIYI